MKNPLLALKEKEHQHAFYAVTIFIMLAILFFLLVSLKTPFQKEEAPIETLVEVSFEAPAASGSESALTSNPTPVTSPDIAVQSDASITVEKSIAPQVDNAFNFKATTGTSDGPTFGDANVSGILDAGPSDAGNSDRIMLKSPDFQSNLQEEGEIALKLFVDADGAVVKALLDPDQSNSGSQYLIRAAIKAAKTIRYNAQAGVPSEYVGTKIFSFKKA